MIAASVIIIAVASLATVNAQPQTDQMTRGSADAQQGTAYIKKFTTVINTCTEQMNADPSIVPACINFIENFNNHMKQFFTQEQSDMQKILLGTTPGQ